MGTPDGIPREHAVLQSSLQVRGRPGAGPEDSLSQRVGRGPTGGAGVQGPSLSAVGIFREVEDRDAESRRSFARVGHRVRFAEKVYCAVYNHSTGRIDFYLLTVITGLSLSLVRSRSWYSPWSSPSVAGSPVAVGCSCPVCVGVFGDSIPGVCGICGSCGGLVVLGYCILALTSFWQWRGIPWRLVELMARGVRIRHFPGFGGLLEIGRFPWITWRFATTELSAQQLAL